MTTRTARGPNIGKVQRGKKCRSCGADAWYRVHYNHHRPHPKGQPGWRCAPCINRHKLAWKAKNRERYRDFSWHDRGIAMTVPEYNLRLLAQEGKCAICGRKPKHKLYVDHCHDTGKTRDLLCASCNQLAQAPEKLTKVLIYVERHRG